MCIYSVCVDLLFHLNSIIKKGKNNEKVDIFGGFGDDNFGRVR